MAGLVIPVAEIPVGAWFAAALALYALIAWRAKRSPEAKEHDERIDREKKEKRERRGLDRAVDVAAALEEGQDATLIHHASMFYNEATAIAVLGLMEHLEDQEELAAEREAWRQ